MFVWIHAVSQQGDNEVCETGEIKYFVISNIIEEVILCTGRDGKTI